MSETLVWIDADGNSTTITNQTDIEVLQGVLGRGMPPYEPIEQEVPLQPGSRLRQVKVKPREITLPIIVYGTSETNLRSNLRSFFGKFNPARGDGTLRVTAPGGDQREIVCRYFAGMELEEGDTTKGVSGSIFQKAILVLRAFDPYFYNVSATSETFTTGTPATFFPFFPLRLTSSTVFADTTVTNGGDVEAWPEWTIEGPGTNIVLRNYTTDRLISISTTLTASEYITIDTRPGYKTVTKNDGTNLYSLMSADSALWNLQKGANSVRLEMSSATADSLITLSYKPRWLGA